MTNTGKAVSSRILYNEPEKTDLTDVGGKNLASSSPASAGNRKHSAFSGYLTRRGDRVFYAAEKGGEEIPVRIVWARPLSRRGTGPLSILQADKKKEVAYLGNIGILDEKSRLIAEHELGMTMLMPVIRKIIATEPKFDNYYWRVETDRGHLTFLQSSPESNTFRPMGDRIVLRDTYGNCYEIPSLAELDAHSRAELDRII